MYLVSLNSDNTIRDVFDSAQSDIETFPITNEEFNSIYAAGNHSLFLYQNGQVIDNAAQIQRLQNLKRIEELKKLLLNSDFKVLPDYDQPDPNVVTQRQAWRQEIRNLQAQ